MYAGTAGSIIRRTICLYSPTKKTKQYRQQQQIEKTLIIEVITAAKPAPTAARRTLELLFPSGPSPITY